MHVHSVILNDHSLSSRTCQKAGCDGSQSDRAKRDTFASLGRKNFPWKLRENTGISRRDHRNISELFAETHMILATRAILSDIKREKFRLETS